ncbi:MAG: peptide chain release factor N(5)-glutamine methyltransferase [Lachnospiraceae bacterium]|nr:peptide chain release factor N(5)-glutamine methyltransferase [Lachnospiraceae bacterium]
MRYRECYEKGVRRLQEADVPEAGLNALLLLEYVCGTGRSDLLAHGDRPLSLGQMEQYEEMFAKRAKRMPLQQITGEQEFMGLAFRVNRNVLIPRQDTEILVEQALKALKPGMRILDLCTGSGCILISLLAFAPECSGLGVDISAGALEVAVENAERILAEGSMRADWLQSDLFEQVEDVYHVITANPPYIPTGALEGLMPEVRDYEPVLALDGREDGLFFYRRIAREAERYLCRGGMLFLEIGAEQASDVRQLLAQNGFADIKVYQDYAGLDRVVRACVP